MDLWYLAGNLISTNNPIWSKLNIQSILLWDFIYEKKFSEAELDQLKAKGFQYRNHEVK